MSLLAGGVIGGAQAAGLDADAAYEVTGVEPADSEPGGRHTRLRYARLSYKEVAEDGGVVKLALSKWTILTTNYNANKNIPYSGQILFTFNNPTFYTQIESVTVNGVVYTSEKDGRLWRHDIDTGGAQYDLPGSATESEVVVTLKDGQTIESLGLSDLPIAMDMVWTNNRGQSIPESQSNTTIQVQASLNSDDADQVIKRNGWVKVKPGSQLVYDAKTRSIKTIHSWKSNQNYLESD